MGLFSQPLNQGRSSVRPATPKASTELYDHDDLILLAPVKGSEPLSSSCSKANKYHLPQRLWNIMQPPKGSSSATMSNLQKKGALDSDTDRSMSPVEEWENDHVTLLPQRKATGIRSDILPSEGEGFKFKTSSSIGSRVSTSTNAPLQKHSSELAQNLLIKSQKKWNRTCSTKSGKHNNGLKKSRKEIEIQFECFLEDDENSYTNACLSSLLKSPNAMKNSSKPTFTRRSKSVQSWLTQTLEAVKKGCINPVNQKKPSEPKGRNASELTRDSDEESQVQIIFERTNVFECTDEYMFSHSIEDDVSCTFSSNHLWENEAPLQFSIPNDVVIPVNSWDHDDGPHLLHNDQNGAFFRSKPVMVPFV